MHPDGRAQFLGVFCFSGGTTTGIGKSTIKKATSRRILKIRQKTSAFQKNPQKYENIY